MCTPPPGIEWRGRVALNAAESCYLLPHQSVLKDPSQSSLYKPPKGSATLLLEPGRAQSLMDSLERGYLRTPCPKDTGGSFGTGHTRARVGSCLIPATPVYSAEFVTIFELSNKTLLKVVAFKLSNIFDLFTVRNMFCFSYN